MSTKAYGPRQRRGITFQRDFFQLKILMGLLAVVLSAAVVQSCTDDGSGVQRITTQPSGGAEEEEEEDPSPRVPPVVVPNVSVPQLSRDEITLRDKIAKEVCIENEDIKSALKDFTCRVEEQLKWLDHRELYDRTPGRDSCYSLTNKFSEEYGANKEEGDEWLKETCTKLAAYAFVQLNFLERKGIGDPVTEDELIEKLETILTDKSWEKLKRGGSSTHLKGLLRMNTYNLNERCSDSLRYDTHKGVVRQGDNDDFEIKQYIFAEKALSKPVEKFIKRFRGYKEISTDQTPRRIEGKKVLKTDATITTIVTTPTTTGDTITTIKDLGDKYYYVTGTIRPPTTATATTATTIATAATTIATADVVLVRHSDLEEEEKDFYFINWPKIRESFKGLPTGVKGEFDYLHFYKRNDDGEKTSTVKTDLIHSIRVLKPRCAGGSVKDERGNNSFAYLRADGNFLDSKELTSPEVNFFSRPRFGINQDSASFKRKNSNNRSNSCKLYKIGYEDEDASDTPDGGEDGEDGIDANFLCVANEVDPNNKLEGYLCYASVGGGTIDDCANDPILKDITAGTIAGSNIKRQTHCMCAIPGRPETISLVVAGSTSLKLEGRTNSLVVVNESLLLLSSQACQRKHRTGSKAFKDIKLQGDSGDLTKELSPLTLMGYLQQEHAEALAGEGDSQGCIAGIDYIDLCGDDNFEDHPEIDSLRSTYCSDTTLFQNRDP